MYLIRCNGEPDFVPALLNDGRVIYSRGEYIGQTAVAAAEAVDDLPGRHRYGAFPRQPVGLAGSSSVYPLVAVSGASEDMPLSWLLL